MSRLGLLRVATLPFETLAELHGAACLPLVAGLLETEDALAAEATALSDALFAAAGPPSDDPDRTRERFLILKLRRAIHNGRPEELDEARAAAVRPDLAARIEMHARGREARARALQAFEAEFAAELRRARRALLGISSAALVEHGIYLASRSLGPKAAALRKLDPVSYSHDQRHTTAKLAAYVARFATKTSPNGVFCAVGLARFHPGPLLIEGTPEISRVEVLLSLSEVRKVAACLAVDPAVECALRPRVNPTLRFAGGAWTFWRAASPRNADDLEVHARVRDHPVLRLFLEAAADGGRDPRAVLAAVAGRSGIAPEELRAFFGRLVEQGILIAEIEVPYSSRRRFRDLCGAARAAGARVAWVETLDELEREVDTLAALDHRARTGAMERIVKQVEPLPRKRPFKADELFRVDSATSLSLRLPHALLDELSAPIATFARLLAGIYPDELNQRVLHRRFLEMHPPDTDVEFLDLYGKLVEETEEGTERPTEFPAPRGSAPEGSREAETLAAQRRVWEWFSARARESSPGAVIEVSDGDIRGLVGDFREPPWAAGVLFQLAAASPADIDEGRYRLVLNALFNGIGLALARFAHLLGDGRDGRDNPVVAELRRAWSVMERPNAVIAELTFNHEARTANAGLRPVLFRHEIELPGDRVSPDVDAIPLSDLVARYDSSRKQVVLRSRARNVEVIPVVSSGVSPSGIVSELIHIGRQGWQTIGYLPGFEAPEVSYWPRIVMGRVVLFRARWLFRETELPPLVDGATPLSEARFFLETARWRRRNRLPRHVFAHTRTEPKPFYVDLESPIFLDLLRRALGARRAAGSTPFLTVTEMIPGPDELWIRGPRGGHAAELLVQMEGGVSIHRHQSAAPADSS